jgi:hypothetical protein
VHQHVPQFFPAVWLSDIDESTHSRVSERENGPGSTRLEGGAFAVNLEGSAFAVNLEGSAFAVNLDWRSTRSSGTTLT